MAANDYFNGFQDQNQNNQHQPPHHTPTTHQKPESPPPQPTWNNPPPSSPTPVGPYANPYEHRYSTYTLGDDHQQYNNNNNMGGRMSEGDQYADNIPLKPNPPQKDGRPEWMDADTHYAPAQVPQTAPLDESGNSGGRGRKNRFFKKKLAWVTYLTTLAQLIVFIIELVRNGTLPSIQSPPLLFFSSFANQLY